MFALSVAQKRTLFCYTNTNTNSSGASSANTVADSKQSHLFSKQSVFQRR